MGTNYYMITQNKESAEKLTNGNYTLTDTPDWGYSCHVAKCSAGWLPLFQAYHAGASSVQDYKAAYGTGEFIIADEYGNTLTWEQFDEDVLQHNGGRLGVIEPVKVKEKRYASYNNMPDYTPVSHLPGTKQSYKYSADNRLDWESRYSIYADDEGYEFDTREFC